MWYLEENHFSTNHLDNIIGSLEGCYKAGFRGMIVQEIVWHIVEKIDDQVIAISQIHK